MKDIQRVLLTQNHLKDYSGSEITTLELAEYFSSLDCSVTILTAYIEEPILSEFRRLSGVKLLIYGSKEAEILKADDFDLVWVHHQLLTSGLVGGLVKKSSGPIVIFHHMSTFHPIEFPIMYGLEKAIADKILYSSKKVQEVYEDKGVIFEGFKNHTFNNPAPENFYRESHNNHKNQPDKIAIISNHPPHELLESINILKGRKDVITDVYGREGGEEARISPEILQKYDVVITIGKTVQYCVASNTPVYCYDYFGGPGYINRDNYKALEHWMFSGRGFTHKTPQAIAKELLEGYESASKNMEKLHKKHAKDLLLPSRLNGVIESISKQARKEKSLKRSDIEIFENYINYRTKLFVSSQEAQAAYKKSKEKIKKKDNRIKELEQELKKKPAIFKIFSRNK